MLVSSEPCRVSSVPRAPVAEGAQHRVCEPQGLCVSRGPCQSPGSVTLTPAERPSPPRWPGVRKRAPPRGSYVRELGRILGEVPVKQEGGSTGRPRGGRRPGLSPIPDEILKAALWLQSPPPGSLSSLSLVEAICLVTLAVPCLSGTPGIKVGCPAGWPASP